MKRSRSNDMRIAMQSARVKRKPAKRGKVRRAKGVRANPSPRAAIIEAERRYYDFTGHDATHETVAVERPIKVGVAIGKLSGVMYEATRDGERAQYFHKFKSSSRPLLIADHDGSRIGIVGGRYRFTERGIVDE